MGIDVMADMSTAQHAVSCPMGACLGCEYATECSRPGRQAAYLRAEVERLKRERDETLRHLEAHQRYSEGMERERSALNARLSDARRAAMEEAAQVADRRADRDEADAQNVRDMNRIIDAGRAQQLEERAAEVREIAAAIRAAAKEER